MKPPMEVFNDDLLALEIQMGLHDARLIELESPARPSDVEERLVAAEAKLDSKINQMSNDGLPACEVGPILDLVKTSIAKSSDSLQESLLVLLTDLGFRLSLLERQAHLDNAH